MSKLMKEPMTVGQILDKSVNFSFKNILWISIIGVLISTPEFVIQYSMPNASLLSWNRLIFGLMSLMAAPFLAGLVAQLLGESFLGNEISYTEAFKKTLKKIIPLILLQILSVLSTVIGIFLLVIPGVIVICATACSVPAMMLENLSPTKAFDRSWKLSKNSRMRIFGYFCIFTCITLLVQGVARLLGNLPIDPIYKLGFSAITTAASSGIWPAITTLLFLDLRIRKEAMDLDMEASTLVVEPVEVI